MQDMFKRILVLGNNTQDTNDRVEAMATASLPNRGLVESLEQDVSLAGYYHTSVVDMASSDILQLAREVDELVLLDQPEEEYTSSKIYLTTYKILETVERNQNYYATRTTFRQNENSQWMNDWKQFFDTNPSFCIYPWILYNDDQGYMTTCSRSLEKITDIKPNLDWKNDPEYNAIRQKMLKGERLPKHCQVCYDYEAKGLDGYRRHDSLDYIAKLGIKSIEDLDKIESPHFYEIRLSNKCNLMCRQCTPIHSHLIKREFRQHPELAGDGQHENMPVQYTSIDVVDIENLTPKHTVYFTGGEPTVMKELYEFMQRCIDAKRTDFMLTMTTNTQYMSEKLWEMGKHFSNLHFSLSIDGYGEVNEYIRWKSKWPDICRNIDRIVKEGHNMTWNHVPTIWGIHRTHELFEWASERYPMVGLYLQYNRVDLHSAFKSPLIEETIESMKRCQKTKIYFNDGKDCRSGVDAFLEHYETASVDLDHLQKFFAWNDLMDHARGIQMKDYIPDLDATRSLL